MLPVDWRRRFSGGLDEERALAPLTTWRIGGPAQLFLEPSTVDDLALAVAQLRRIGMPYRVLGGGSNLLVSDRGVRGAVLSLARLDSLTSGDGFIDAGAGARLHQVVTFAARQGHAGLEHLVGIPGRLGGAIFGNAGSKQGAIGDRVFRLDLLEPGGTLVRLAPDAGFFRYRRSRVGERIVVGARLKTGVGDPRGLRSRIRELIAVRRRTQPGWIGNAGCVFRNPGQGGAGGLIDSAGCKGMRVGNVFVSHRHANFFENGGGGCARDVYRLVDQVCDRVRRVHGIELELEVQRWE